MKSAIPTTEIFQCQELIKNFGLKIESLHCRTKTFSQSDINNIPLIRDVMVTELWTHVFRVLLETLIYGTMTFSFSSLLREAFKNVLAEFVR